MKNLLENHKYKIIVGIGISLIIIIIALMKFIPKFNFWIWEDHGTVADWVSGLGTVAAFIWGIYVINKQTNIQRALNIENQRPRFSFERSSTIYKGNIIMRPKVDETTTLDGIQKKLNNHEGYVFVLHNISSNQIYSMKIILKHDGSQKDIYIYHGLISGKTMVLIPHNYINCYEEIFIKFRSSANEIGYMRNRNKENTKYYFVKDKNNSVSVYGDDQLISKSDSICQSFNREFNTGISSSYFFIAERNIKEKSST